ncbi:alpha/beta hydrolase [Mastigocoleus sp. MO_188.B34]|uniref:alpha/beta fold hydrolase n=1 Tax=Mastigocoleus sp. MO_188.B34 TaxID=3036635 RepID=UPI0026036F47|nr:alpha/beta hydrolase [Mastigocoleus sp. MO_188.B34]MDJ0694300.1 alpha/beta hydrolase [Mastigocoleus sp. MO_188.B34]
MLEFQPSGFGKKLVETSLGSMVYYSQTSVPWDISQVESLPKIVFLHNFGGGASAYEWSKVYPAFASNYHILAPDLIGWGNSAHPMKNYQINDYITTIREFIQKTCSSPVILVASSLTAALAIRIAIQHPELFQRLFLVCPSGFNDFGENAGRRLPLEIINTPVIEDLIYLVGAENEISVRNFLESFLFVNRQKVSQEIVQAYLNSAQKPNAKYAALAFLRGDLYFDLSLYISQLSIPTIFLWGEKAQFTKSQLGERLAKLNRNAIEKFYSIEDAGILPHLETPEVIIGLMQKHL